jgi:hypothetical protein
MSADPLNAMAKAIEDLVARRDHVSFAELDRMVPGFAPIKSDEHKIVLSVAGHPVWSMSEDGDAALWLLLDQRRICLTPSTPLVYLCDGAMLRDDKWRPMVLRPGREANFISESGMPLHVSKQGVAIFRRGIARDKKAGRPHWTEIVKGKAYADG